jgi:anti-sigma factor RsiW
MDCRDAQLLMIDDARGRLTPELQAAVREHTSGCAACDGEARAEKALDDVLASRLPNYRAPATLRRRLKGAVSTPIRPATRASFWIALAAAVVALTIGASGWRVWTQTVAANDGPALVREAINDHLRITFSEHPIEIASGGIHQVKPWFSGKVEFAPVVAFAGDDDFPLLGGSVAYFIDRKAATFLFQRRLHRISLLVFPAEGFRWPTAGERSAGHVNVLTESARGFNVLLWKSGDLGYALVSDVDASDLHALAMKLTPKS